MTLTVNGERFDAEGDGFCDAELLEALELSRGRVAVEVNRELVRRSEFGETALHEGDKVEVVHFVGGG